MRRAPFFNYSTSNHHNIASNKPGYSISHPQHHNKQHFIKESTPKPSKSQPPMPLNVRNYKKIELNPVEMEEMFRGMAETHKKFSAY